TGGGKWRRRPSELHIRPLCRLKDMDQSAPTIRHPKLPAPRPRRPSLLWLLGAVLLAYSPVIAATGGIDVMVAGVRIRSRTWQRPVMLAIVCLATVDIGDRRRGRLLGT